MSYSSCSCFVCLTGPYIFVYLALEQIKFGTILSYWPLDVQHGPSGHINSLRIWELELLLSTKSGRGYKKFGNSLELSYSTVARVIQRVSKTGFTRNRPRKGSIKEVEFLLLCVRCRIWLQKQMHACCQHCFRGLQKWNVSLSVPDHTPTHCNKSVCMAVVPEGSLFWSWLNKKSLQTVCWRQPGQESMNYWSHVLWSDESKVNLFDSDGVQHVWRCPGEEYQEYCVFPTVKHGGW